jgi:L-lactate dehydrogenase complex protein LldE
MRLALYVTCLVDLMRPSVGFASLRLLESAGCEVVVPEGQTCCGQPAWSAGNRALAADLAKKAITELAGYDYVVIPSGSCTDQIRNVYPQLFANDAEWGPRARALAERAYELTQFLVDVLKFSKPLVGFDGSVTYHDSCKGLRGLGIKQQPRELLLKVAGLSLKEMPDCEECCGFGGAFSVRFGEVSTQIVDRKCESIARGAADAVVGGDLGCLINIEGRLRRRGDLETRVLHIAEVLAGGAQ